MLDTADILINRKPFIDSLFISRAGFPRRGEPCEIPGAIHEGVHGVGFALGCLAAFRARAIAPCRMAIKRVARLVKIDVVRQLDRQVFFFLRNNAAIRAVDHRNWASPIALTGNTPVAKTILCLAQSLRLVTDHHGFQFGRNSVFCIRDGQAIKELGIEDGAFAGVGLVSDIKACRIGIFWQHKPV